MTASPPNDTGVPPYLAIVGPTASGKSQLAMEIASHLPGEIVNSDSVQLYRGFDIGAAKPSRAEQAAVPHHLLDVVGWDEPMDAARYAVLARSTIRAIAERGRLPIVVGGSGLYLRSLWGERFHDLPTDAALRSALKARPTAELYDELRRCDLQRALAIHPNDHVRIVRALEIARLTGRTMQQLTESTGSAFAPRCLILLDPPRANLKDAIAERSRQMLSAGLIPEVAALLAEGCPPTAKVMQSIGYKQVAAHLAGHALCDDLAENITIATRQYAKRQMTWFRKVSVDLHLTEKPPILELVNSMKAYFAF